MRLAWGILLVLAFAPGCRNSTNPYVPQESPPDLATAPVTPLAPKVKVVANDPTKLNGPGESIIKMPSTREMYLRLELPSVPNGVFWVTLKFFTPNGGLYELRHIPYSTTPTGPIPSPDGVPHPIDVLPVVPISGGYGIDSLIMVGGTNLMRRPDPGLWKVSMAVDGSASLAAETIVEMGLMP